MRTGRPGLGRSGNADLVPRAPGALRLKPRASPKRTSPAQTNIAMHDRSASGRAVVIRVRDRDALQAELVEHRLTRGGFAEGVAEKCRLDGIVLDL